MLASIAQPTLTNLKSSYPNLLVHSKAIIPRKLVCTRASKPRIGFPILLQQPNLSTHGPGDSLAY